MRHATYALALSLTFCFTLGLGAPYARASTLPHLKPLPRCSLLRQQHGTRYDKHLLYHLAPKGQYARMYATIQGESSWRARAKNRSSTASGYAQFLSFWWADRWHWNPFNGPLNIRVFVYCIEHPRETGGWSNWAGH